MKNIREYIYIGLGCSLYSYFLYAPREEMVEILESPLSVVYFCLNVIAMILVGKLFSTQIKWGHSIFHTVLKGALGMWLVLAQHTYFLGLFIFKDVDPLFILDMRIKTMLLLFSYSIAILVIEYLMLAYQHFNQQHLSLLTYQRKSAQLRLEALKSQLSPHYLFNSLNTVAFLVIEDTKQADRYIRSIAQTYQFVMKYAQKALISLDEELQVVRAFAFQLQTRHGKSVEIHLDKTMQSIEGKLPPLSVQLLVENAVKHNVLSDDDPIEIHIDYIKEQQLVKVRNNTTTSPKTRISTKVGLNNLKERYALLSDQEISIQHTSTSYTVQLPLL
ncbi:sensor histidine kinase [Flammeovirga pacifica]|uniref:Signal transduction histidine kinase internal region domain-containing protein n=1 Tax=Flammeovirga pacifica TaxID=915059 RepID=A0A1S1YS02_FLAPC|nr:histidine kinase [Flammeovirga pacifica]OHX63819.1 hypothetical protein NH26_19600 [Flammeovirga pacifica]